jgi:expansin (peptidoglycan-binding protein)
VPKRFGYEIKTREELKPEDFLKFDKLDYNHFVVSRNSKNDTFNKLITEIRTKLKKTLGPTLFEKYIIQDIKNRYVIDLPKRSVNIRFDV